MTFVHLHTHSEYSWLDGACCIDDLVQRALQQQMPAVAITDRNSVAGAYRLWHRCIKAGIKPIIGLEIEVLNDISDGRAFSVILIAKNGDGFSNLCRLLTLAHTPGTDHPRITKSQLMDNSTDLICLSFSVVGELCTLLLEGKDAHARQVSNWYHDIFGDDFYYEVQNHGLPREATAMNKLLNLAYQTKIPVVLTNDCHYMEHRDSLAIDALNCIRKGIGFNHPDAKRFACNEYFFKTADEMKSLYGFPPDLIKNTTKIAGLIDFTGAYLPTQGGFPALAPIMDILKRAFPGINIQANEQAPHLTLSLPGYDLQDVLRHLQSSLPECDVLPLTQYRRWTPAGIYAAVLRAMRVPYAGIAELCEMIPPEAKTLLEATLISTDFSCFSYEDYVYHLAMTIGDTLIDTFESECASESSYIICPFDSPLPIIHDESGKARCPYDSGIMETPGVIHLTIHP